MTDEHTADQLADLFWRDGSHQSIRTAIVRALQQAREEGKRSSFDSTNPPDPKPLVWLNGKKVAPAGHIIDDQGVVRRVLGTLVLTADGCVWAHGANVYWHEDPHEQSLENINDDIAFFEEHGTDADGEVCGTWEKVSQCYSTREAAEAAKEAK